MTDNPTVLHIQQTICKCGNHVTASQIYEVVEKRPDFKHLVPYKNLVVFKPQIVQLPTLHTHVCDVCVHALAPHPNHSAHARAHWRDSALAAVLGIKPQSNPNDLSDIA